MEAGRRPETILLVDDEPMVRKLATTVLRMGGFRVVHAGDAATALALARAHAADLDLLLTDVSMPGRSGVDLARDLADVCPDLPVVFMSGFNENAAELEGCGARLLSKPFTPAALTDRVRLALSHADPTPTTTAFA